ncbi:cysteine proteinase [Dentipellis sp. KUC8613]|nr:cysteine proteinase [Dentipellis sp. KUC8613]
MIDNTTSAPGRLFDGAFIRSIPSPYTPSQIRQYLKNIGWPALADAADDSLQSNASPDTAITFDANLENLSRLMYLHTVAFPTDNSDMHYTPEHLMPVEPQRLFTRMVAESKGSYCFGHNGLLLGILRGLGYRAYPASARVLLPRPPAANRTYTYLSHLLLLVQPHADSNITYAVDVGFGGTGPLRPILLADGRGGRRQHVDVDNGVTQGGWVWGTFPPERHRLVRAAYPASSLGALSADSTAPLRDWHMQVSHDPARAEAEAEAGWMTLYTFAEAEFFQRDIEVASYAVCRLPGTVLSDSVVAIRRFAVRGEDARGLLVVREDDGGAAGVQALDAADAADAALPWVGKWTLEDRRGVKRVGGAKLEEVGLASELERVRMLREVFGISVADGDVKWIEGTKVAFRPEGAA